MANEKRANTAKVEVRPGMGPGPGRRPGGPAGRFMRAVEKPKNTKKVLGRLVKYIGKFKVLFIFLFIVVILTTGTTLGSNLVVKDIVASLGSFSTDENGWILAPNEALFYRSIVILIVLYVIHCICQYFTTLIGALLAIKTTRKLRNDLFAKMVKFPISYTDTHAHGDLMSRMTNDVLHCIRFGLQ